MEAGGSVLWLIALLVLLMWGLIFERIYYLSHGHDVFLNSLVSKWDSRADKTSWHALQIREKFLAEAKSSINKNTTLIKTCIALAPLFGLLGTVTGMIKTFKQITLFGTGDAKSLSEGISEALITTELGLVAAIPSLILYAILSRKSKGILSEMERLSSHFINEFPKKKKEDVSLTDHSDSDEPDEPTIDLNPQPA